MEYEDDLIEIEEEPEEVYRRIGEMDPDEFHPELPILCSVEAIPNIYGLCC